MSFLSRIFLNGQLRLNSWHVDYLRHTHPLRYLFWEATLNCNFNCLHCGSRASRQKHYQNELTTQEIKSVYKSIAAKSDPRKIMIAVTGGEPLLRPDLFEVMAYAHGLGFNWGMVTNGSLVTPKVVEQMKQSGMSTIVVSIDGIGKVHDDFRQAPGSYKKAVEVVKLLAQSKYFQNVQITTTIHQSNIVDLEKMYAEFLPLGIQSWRVMNIDPIGRALDNKKLLLKPKDLKKLLEFIKQKRLISSIDITYDCTGFLGLKYEGRIRDWFFYCSTGITTASILHNGDIFVCPNVPRLPELIQGNIRQDDFYDIWQKQFKVYRQPNRTSCSGCQKCLYWTECRGGSFHLWDFEKKQPKFCHLEYLE